jgi:hypothetical protein
MQIPQGLADGVRTVVSGLKGADRRRFMAQVVRDLGRGGLIAAMRTFKWGVNTIRKGQRELATGVDCQDATHMRGRKPAESRLPDLRADIESIVESQCQTDPRFHSERLYSRLTAEEVRRQLIAKKGYADEGLPKREGIRRRLVAMGYTLQRVQKIVPKKKFQKPMPSSIRWHKKTRPPTRTIAS